jgi:ketosteroid isomerase-like protein
MAATPMDVESATRRWIEAWSRAWPVGDTDAVAAIYAHDASFSSHPFREPQPAAEYAAWAFGEQRHAECRFGEPIVSGDRAAVDWWAVITAVDGSEETVAGTSLLRFGSDGLVVEQRDVWASLPGRVDVPAWAAS